jgi:hypothetical protein
VGCHHKGQEILQFWHAGTERKGQKNSEMASALILPRDGFLKDGHKLSKTI